MHGGDQTAPGRKEEIQGSPCIAACARPSGLRQTPAEYLMRLHRDGSNKSRRPWVEALADDAHKGRKGAETGRLRDHRPHSAGARR
jgi:hypothetical protein